MPAKLPPNGLLYQNKQHYGLIDPNGSAVFLGSEERCVCEYYFRRFGGTGGLILNDEDTARARRLLKQAGWEVIPVVMGVFTRETDLRKLQMAG